MKLDMKGMKPRARLDTREGIEEFIDNFKVFLKTHFETSGRLMPMSVVFVTVDPETGDKLDAPAPVMLLAAGEFAPEDRETFAQTMRRVSVQLGAVGVVFATEGWTAQLEDPDYLRWRARHPDAMIADYPDRREILMLTCEHRAIGTRCWMAAIVRDVTPEQPKLGKFAMMDDGTTGRFLRMLPEQVLS